MTHSDTQNIAGLDAMLAEAADRSDLAPDTAFMTRMMQDALAHQPVAGLVRVPWWHQLASILGGWQGMGGLVAATCAGLWIGINPPDLMPASLETLLNIDAVYSDSDDTADLIGFGWDLEEV